MAFKSVVATLTTSDADIFEMPATLEGAAVLGIGNITSGSVDWTLKYFKYSTGVTTTLVSAQPLAAKVFKKFEIPLLMEAGDKLIASASANTSIKTFASIPESSATPIAKGFVPKGTYSAIATYDRNDLADDGAGNSYISMSDGNIGHTPASSPLYWMQLALRGLTGTGDVTGPGVSVNNNVVTMNGTTGKIIKDSGYGISTSGANLGVLNADNTIGGANVYSKPQKSTDSALTTSVAAAWALVQRWVATVNGGAFVIANPSSGIDGVYYAVEINFTTSHGVTFGSNFKVTGYTPTATAGKKDRLIFQYDSVSGLFYLVGFRNDVGT